MNVQEQIKKYITSQPEPKRYDEQQWFYELVDRDCKANIPQWMMYHQSPCFIFLSHNETVQTREMPNTIKRGM
jgi:hypothetical protein